MLKIAVLAGTSRPSALNPQVVDWVHARLAREEGIEAEIVRFADFDLPLLDEEIPGGAHQYANEHTKAWGRKLEEFDGYVVVTPEYNHSIPGSLKNALDFVFQEFGDKVVGFVGYGANGGVRAVEALRLVFANYRTAAVRGTGAFSIIDDVADGRFAPRDSAAEAVDSLVEDLVSWGEAFKALRAAK